LCQLFHSPLSLSSRGSLKILKSPEEQESEKRIKMQHHVVEVLETNGKSKKCNPVESGLYNIFTYLFIYLSLFKAQKLDFGILDGGSILSTKLPEKPPTIPIEAKKEPCHSCSLLDVVGVPEKKEIPLIDPRSPAFVRKKRTPKPTQEDEDEEQPVPKIPVRRNMEIGPFSFDSKNSLTEGEENKTTAEKGGAQLLGTSFASF
ncbi:hypothetical protein FD754_012580, partial [Muntiacus muntjak]